MTTTQHSATPSFEVRTIAPIRVAAVRHVGPYEACETAWQTLCGWAGPKGLLGPKAVFMGLSHDDPSRTPTFQLRYDACIAIADDVAIEADAPVHEITIAGGDFLCAIHHGPYSELFETYVGLFAYVLPRLGRECSCPSVEVYLEDCTVTPADKLRTEIRIPLK
ncbi:DNA gyrase inhibitor GyrI [Desulfobaculum xiamenense]|uniref:DNA gyrase inhibitor GyrI n=1 Tax=Desulfobaculum xiamenense TaxID=995050 RepID=A0A846QVK9_9BACT|nr:GyrI-like domain-containing protein [Desulfobaculum xiamenense]NJB69154.1 DNA gyrase inhibitor GyrI [Desulfobaculum xiamenense]